MTRVPRYIHASEPIAKKFGRLSPQSALGKFDWELTSLGYWVPNRKEGGPRPPMRVWKLASLILAAAAFLMVVAVVV